MVSIYQEAINRAATEAAEKAGIERLFNISLNLSKKYDRSFESALDDCTDSPSEKKICMEKYKKMIG